MILRHSTTAVLLAVFAYTILFALTRASGHLNHHSGAANATCVACDTGYHAGDTEHCNCTVCDCTHIDPHCNCSGYCETNSSCLLCEPGHYSDKRGTAVCKECPHGTHYDDYGAVECKKCDPGTYTDQTGQTQCSDCPPGKNASRAGANECTLCPLGFTCKGGGCATCEACPAGQSSSENRTLCEECALGSSSPKDGHPCETCRRGLICDQLGCVECRPCPDGQQPQDNTSTQSCEKCLPGQYKKLSEGLFCKPCPPGTYQERNGENSCESCPENYFCPNPTDKRKCLDGGYCPPGSTSTLFCQNLFTYNKSSQECVPSTLFIVVMALIVVFVAVVVVVTILTVYCHAYHRRILRSKMPAEKIPLTKEPVTEPVYSGH